MTIVLVRGRQQGFSLLEVLVAFTILALSLGVLMQIFSGTLRNTDLVGKQALATAIAQNLIETACNDAVLVEKHDSGETETGLSWRIDISPFFETTNDEGGISEQLLYQLWQLSVSVSWGNDDKDSQRSIQLVTLLIQRVPLQ